jgi:hypothetical protein
MTSRSSQQLLVTALPLVLAILPAMARGHGGVSLAALAVFAPLSWWLGERWRLVADPFVPTLYLLALAGLAAVVPGLWWARGWRETLFWVLLVGGLALAAGPDRSPLFALRGLVIGLFTWLVRWALGRGSGPIALGGLVGAVAGVAMGESYAQQLFVAALEQRVSGVSPGRAALYIEVCLTFVGAVVGGILSPRAEDQRLSAGDQVVPSVNTTSSR